MTRIVVRGSWVGAYDFACHSAACRPPTSGGTGGSTGGTGSSGGVLGKDPTKRASAVATALKAVGEGESVAVSKKTAATMVAELGGMAIHAAGQGSKAKSYDLCKVSVPGTNLFCGANKGVVRSDMPQFSGIPRPGSKAADLPSKPNGEVDGAKAFEAHMASQGVKIFARSVKASDLKASQTELIGTKVGAMMRNKHFDPAGEAIFVSKDGYVIDGHHRWAAQVARDLQNGHLGDLKLNVRVVNMNITDVLKAAKTFTSEFGIQPKAGA